MSTISQSPLILPSKLTTTTAAAKPPSISISSSFLPLRHLRRRLPSLKIAQLRQRRSAGAAGAKMADTAASRYANAFAEVAKSNGTLEATIVDVEKLDTFFSDEDVQGFFANPTISMDRKAEMVAEIAKAEGLKPHTANFLNILVDMDRIGLVKEIVKEFEDCYNKITGTEVAVVSAVVKLESEHLAQISKTIQKLTGAKNVRIKTLIDPTLVAGFTIRYGSSGSKLIDMSVKKQLDEIAAQLDFSLIGLA